MLVTVIAALTPAGVASDTLYGVVGLAAAVAILVGVRLHRPVPRLPWLLMASAQLFWVAGDLYYSWHDDIAGLDTYPTIGDVLYLLAYPLFAGSLLVLVMHRLRRGDVGGLLDSATITAGLALLSWVLLARPALAQVDSSWTAVAVTVLYPLGDIILVGGLIRLLGSPGNRTASLRLLLVAVGLLVTADVVYAAMNLHSDSGTDWINALWLSSYVAWGAAALHPSMTRVAAPSTEVALGFSWARLTAFSVATLTAPAVLAVESLAHVRLDVWAVVVGSVVMFSLVVIRMYVAIHQIARVNQQRAQLEDELVHRAAHDALTGLVNRPQVMTLLDGALGRSRRTGGMIGLLFVDLDGFKTVNDTFGHQSGDTVLRVVAERLLQQVRTGDTVARLGGDEFVVLLEPVDAETSAVVVSDRLIAAVSRPIDLGRSGTAKVGASVGVALSRGEHATAEAFLHEADTAAYRAKTGGRGRTEVYDIALREELAVRADLEDGVRAAIGRDELVLHYQPVVDLRSGEVVSYEALVRWLRPGYGLLSPAEFIAIAESSELICDIDAWVLGRATRDFAALGPDSHGRLPEVGVNISGRHLSRPRILDDVAVALRRSGLSPRRLMVELTETTLVNDALTLRHLTVLREGGVSISIDDFGTGYKAISQLGTLPMDSVKIDRRFVDPDSTAAPILLQLMVEAAHAHHLPVVVEGVEHEHQLRTLQALGCEAAQGYLLGRPGPLAEVVGRDVPVVRRVLTNDPD